MYKPQGESASQAMAYALGQGGQWTLMTPPVEKFEGITERECILARRYTGMRSVVREDGSPALSVWLLVGQQQFQLAVECETGEEAAWHCWQLAKALARFSTLN